MLGLRSRLGQPQEGPDTPKITIYMNDMLDNAEAIRIKQLGVDWIDAAGDYMCIHAEGETHVIRTTMKELESQLDPQRFQRIHRSTLVNIDRVERLVPHTNGEYFVILTGGAQLKLSRTYRDKLSRFL